MSEIKQYSLSEVQKHNKKSDLWIIVHHNGMYEPLDISHDKLTALQYTM